VKNANLVRRMYFRLILIIAVVHVTPGCDRTKTPVEPIAAAKTVNDFFEIRVGDHAVRMQIAVSLDEMQRGLMERRDLGPDDGMLFVYKSPQQMSFWMRNTPTALDIGFFNVEGVLEEVYPLHPFDETTVQSRSKSLRFALEMNQGWYRERGVRPGARIDMVAIAAALRARGMDPAIIGLPTAELTSKK
jgi:uncharacterized membrane protein (UPF0127 family)